MRKAAHICFALFLLTLLSQVWYGSSSNFLYGREDAKFELSQTLPGSQQGENILHQCTDVHKLQPHHIVTRIKALNEDCPVALASFIHIGFRSFSYSVPYSFTYHSFTGSSYRNNYLLRGPPSFYTIA